MKIRHLVLAAALVGIALPASAVVKAYNATPPNGTGGDQIQFSTTLCPPIQTTPGNLQGSYRLSDTGSGTVTIDEWNEVLALSVSFPDLTAIFGPGTYVFSFSDSTFNTTVGQVAPGSTAPGGTVDWGVLSGFTRSGIAFCISSPQTICTGGTQVPHGVTSPSGNANSPTYDVGTWVFDAEGDFQAAAPYIIGTFNGGTSNIQFLLRGAFQGGSIPALPLVGLGAVALGVLGFGARSLLRRR